MTTKNELICEISVLKIKIIQILNELMDITDKSLYNDFITILIMAFRCFYINGIFHDFLVPDL